MHSSEPSSLLDSIHHAAHLLPAQGPITVFVHHNTLHAFEHLSFDEAVRQAGSLFGCRCYWPEARYRDALRRGRMQTRDLEQALLSSLGDQADQLVGGLGTRFHLRRAMILHELQSVTANELEWVMAETNTWEKFCVNASAEERQRMVTGTQRWILRRQAQPNGNGDWQSSIVPSSLVQSWMVRARAANGNRPFEQWRDQDWERFCLKILWQICDAAVERFPPQKLAAHAARLRDPLLEITGQDSDQVVNEVLVRFCMAMLDQGMAQWTMPGRERGFWICFQEFVDTPSLGQLPWWHRLRTLVRLAKQNKQTAEASIAESLQTFGVDEAHRTEFIEQTLLALRGFGGMIWQLESRGDRATFPLPPGTMVEFVAIRLLLDRAALSDLAARELGFRGPLRDLPAELTRRQVAAEPATYNVETFVVFQLAQMIGWLPQALLEMSEAGWRRLLAEIREFDALERTRIFHLALESGFREQALSAIINHQATRLSSTAGGSKNDSAPTPTAAQARTPKLEVICCIDDREESLRRHLEEIDPQVRTWGAAGFFAVPMYYQGAEAFQFKPLCPIVIQPQHYVREYVGLEHQGLHERRARVRQTIGQTVHGLHRASRGVWAGAAASLFGTWATIPLVMRVLFPRITARFNSQVAELIQVPKQTYLQLERQSPEPGNQDAQIGFTLREMADMVERLLRDIGLTQQFAPLVLIIGHGSSSLNNPHESAYNCGACGGGRGGPNARAMAQMANDYRVREQLKQRGLEIPASTFFVSMYHNTCDDSIVWFDLSLVPPSHQANVRQAQEVLVEARKRNAHERCRRFVSADLSLTREAALKHVESRAEDLSQTRPEYNHATNAMCMVGPRELTYGLYLDRRSFLVSYDGSQDDSQRSILARILGAVVPVCSGINLEYYFSAVDVQGFGCGTKLPHNVTSLVGVMDGAASDLRTGLSAQMTEIHEPLRLLFVIACPPDDLLRVIKANPQLWRIFSGQWSQLAAWDSGQNQMWLFDGQQFHRYHARDQKLAQVKSSYQWYHGWRHDLEFAQLNSVMEGVNR